MSSTIVLLEDGMSVLVSPTTTAPSQEAEVSPHPDVMIWIMMSVIVKPLSEVEHAIRTNGWSHLTHHQIMRRFYQKWYWVNSPEEHGELGHGCSPFFALMHDEERAYKMARASALIGEITARWWMHLPKPPWRRKLFILADNIRRLRDLVDEMRPTT